MQHIQTDDWVKQSIPFSYMSFTAKSLDGASHAVQVYSDVSGGTPDRPEKPAIPPQLCCRVELRGSVAENSVALNVQFRCRLS